MRLILPGLLMLLMLLPIGISSGSERRPVKSLLELRREGVVIQGWDLSCGAAVLATLLAYQHDDPVPEQEVATELLRRKHFLDEANPTTIRLGFSLLDLKQYADERGYRGVGFAHLGLTDLVELAPTIAPVRFNGYDHFVIFRGVLGNRVLLADPAWGNRTMLIAKFMKAWIDYPGLGYVGFVVQRRDGLEPANRLQPRPSDFPMLR